MTLLRMPDNSGCEDIPVRPIGSKNPTTKWREHFPKRSTGDRIFCMWLRLSVRPRGAILMRRILIFGGCGCLMMAVRLPAAQAQNLTVQEPTLETFGVGTTVSVPDRGRISVAGSGRSAASRSSFGPLRSGTNIGLSNQASGLSVGATVHDLAEMDRRILAGAERSRSSRAQVELSASADRAYETLRSRTGARSFADVAQSTNSRLAVPRASGPSSQVAEGPTAERLLDRARQAESNGKRALALAYLRSAQEAGSAEARHEIERLSPKRK